MQKVQFVCFHYDDNNPQPSKHLKDEDNDESRFDVITAQRKYMLKSVHKSMWDSQAWVQSLAESAQKFNPNYRKNNESDESDSSK